MIKTKPLTVSPWKYRSAKYGLKALKNACKLGEVLKAMDIHDMKCQFKTAFDNIIPHVGCIGPKVMKSGTPVFR